MGLISKAIRGAATTGAVIGLDEIKNRAIAKRDAKLAGYRQKEQQLDQEFHAAEKTRQMEHDTLQQREQQAAEGGFSLSPGQTRYDAIGNPIANQPNRPDRPDSSTGFALSPGQTRFDAQGNPIASLPTSAEDPTTHRKKYDELVGMGVPDDVARGVAYGLYQEIKDTRGNPMLVDIGSGGVVGSMVRDTTAPGGGYRWESSRQAGAPAATAGIPAASRRVLGRTYEIGGKRYKWMGSGWLPAQ